MKSNGWVPSQTQWKFQRVHFHTFHLPRAPELNGFSGECVALFHKTVKCVENALATVLLFAISVQVYTFNAHFRIFECVFFCVGGTWCDSIISEFLCIGFLFSHDLHIYSVCELVCVCCVLKTVQKRCDGICWEILKWHRQCWILDMHVESNHLPSCDVCGCTC